MVSLPSRKLALIVEYDGARYHGFQIQVGVPTIQGDIERAVTRATSERVRVVGAGRTDAGVHARGQIVSFGIASSLSLATLVRALNHYLMPDIAVKGGRVVDDSFNARRGAISREYRYTIFNASMPSPLERRYAHFVPLPLDIDAMNEACQSLVGMHDFASFTGATKGRTTRVVSRATVSGEGELVFFDMAANSFLPRQVRCTAGSLIRVGLGKLTVDEFRGVLEAKRAGVATPVAPPGGLCLMKVEYPEYKFNQGQIDENL